MSPAAATIEAAALRWTLDALRLPADSGGAFVVGATMANFTALAAARHAVLARAGWNVDDDGLHGAPPVTVVVGAEVHVDACGACSACSASAATRALVLPVDGQGRIAADDLPRARRTGDRLPAGRQRQHRRASTRRRRSCAWAHEHGAWVHVDGAFGLWARACPGRASQADGYELADSWATDAHKWLNVPYDCGIAMVRDEAALRAAMAMTAAYLPPSGVRDPDALLARRLTPRPRRRRLGGAGLPRPRRPRRPASSAAAATPPAWPAAWPRPATRC